MTAALETIGLTRRFGGLIATNEIGFRLERGARHALIGPNGAGKTTFVNLLTGLLAPSAGRVLLGGADITRMSPDRRVRRGMARTFQINQLFPRLAVLEALTLVVSERRRLGRRWWRAAGGAAVADEVAGIAERFRLGDVLEQPIRTLSYGRQRLLEIALAIASRPNVLLLDEPAAGVPEGERQDILAAVGALSRDVSVLLIEHDMDLVFSFAERISVLVDGALFAEGAAETIAADPRVRAVYLGEGADE